MTSSLRRVLLFLLLLGCSSVAMAARAVRYELELSVDFANGTVAGDEVVVLHGDGTAELDAAEELTIADVSLDGAPLAFERSGARIVLRLPKSGDDLRRLRIRYSGKPAKGLRISAEQAFSAFHTDHWMVCDMDPAEKATLRLAVIVPEWLEAVATGRAAGRDALDNGRARYRFELDQPYSAYLFGFAAARFTDVEEEGGRVALRYAGTPFTAEELKRVFRQTPEMLAFFEERAGVPYPLPLYTQVLMPNGPAQEMAGMSVMSDRYGRSLLDDPREDYLLIHELAHQWWGNLVTCRTWSDFWLNEGTATYMVAAYKERFWGRDEYDREMAMAHLRYENALAKNEGRSLVYTRWKNADEMGGPVTYSRGALVLHLLRRQLGDTAFWNGIRDFTRAHAGGSVDSNDLRAAMEKASGRELRAFFAQWVTGAVPDFVARHTIRGSSVDVEIEQRQADVWSFPLTIAVEGASERITRRVDVTKRKQTFRIALKEPVVSVVIDPERELPDPIAHERPVEMLVRQLEHESGVSARVGALRALEKTCTATAPPAGCSGFRAALQHAIAEDNARIVRTVATQTLERLH